MITDLDKKVSKLIGDVEEEAVTEQPKRTPSKKQKHVTISDEAIQRKCKLQIQI